MVAPVATLDEYRDTACQHLSVFAIHCRAQAPRLHVNVDSYPASGITTDLLPIAYLTSARRCR